MPERWVVYALLSAAAGSVIPVLARFGLKGVDPNAASILRSVAMTVSLLLIATALGVWDKFHTLWRPEPEGLDALEHPIGAAGHAIAWRPVAVVALTGVAGAVSWLFYFKALKLADVSKVAPIDKLGVPMAILLAAVVLAERPSLMNWIGIALVCGGAYLAALPSK